MENENLILQLAKIIVAQSEQAKTAPQAPQSEPSVKSEAVDLKNVSENDFIEELFRRYPKLERDRRELALLAGVRSSTFYLREKKTEQVSQVSDDMSVRNAYLYLPACYSINQLYALIRDEKIPYKKKSENRYYFSRTAIDEWYAREGYALLAPSREVGGAPVPPDELPAKNDFITPHQVLELLPVKRKRDTIYRWVRRGMPHYFMGVQLKFSEKEVREWLRQQAGANSVLKLNL